MSAWMQGTVVAVVVLLAAVSVLRQLWPRRKSDAPSPPACGTSCARCRACK